LCDVLSGDDFNSVKLSLHSNNPGDLHWCKQKIAGEMPKKEIIVAKTIAAVSEKGYHAG
jgi:hypothetical protein